MPRRATVFITRQAEFAAAHRLSNPKLSDAENDLLYGLCAHKGGHGHNYVLEVTLKGSVNPRTGMLIDLKRVKEVIEREVVAKCDHRNLNVDPDFLKGVIPTAENVAIGCYDVLASALPRGLLDRVRLYESARNFVDYYGPRPSPARRQPKASIIQPKASTMKKSRTR